LRRQRLDQLAAGAIEMQLKNLLTGLIVYGADDVGSIVQEVREAHKFRAS
jgi:hypothetical protein